MRCRTTAAYRSSWVSVRATPGPVLEKCVEIALAHSVEVGFLDALAERLHARLKGFVGLIQIVRCEV
jgi:hypothetical protein